jgi:predicted DNA repair protein MutK
MASGFFALLDDIAVLMDDVAATSKIATKKTAGILGDDLAVNAEKASGFVSSREIPVLWAITKGSFLNKLIILPIAFLLSAFLPIAVTIILLLGAVYLAFEGAEKIYEWIFPHAKQETVIAGPELTEEEILALEKDKIKSAIVTDFILSIEIVIIALSSVVKEPIVNQILVVSVVAVIATIGVYGIVAAIVRMDDLGARLIRTSEGKRGVRNAIGSFLVAALPWIVKSLAVIGTIALLLVAGGIVLHDIHYIEELLHSLPSLLAELITGLVVGIIALAIFKGIKHLFFKKSDSNESAH